MRVVVTQSYGWRAASCEVLVRRALPECDTVFVLAESDYAAQDAQKLRDLGATVVPCPPNNQARLAQWFRWLWLDRFAAAHPDASVLLVDDDRLVLPSVFFERLVSDKTFLAGGGTPTKPIFAWCGVSCFQASLLLGFPASTAFWLDASAGAVRTDEIALNIWLQKQDAQVSVVPLFQRQTQGDDPRSLRRRPEHVAARKEQFKAFINSGHPGARDIVTAVALSEWPYAERVSFLERFK